MNKLLRLHAEMPEVLLIGEQQLIILGAVLAAAAPQEGCALLLGPVVAAQWWVAAVWPCLNVWQPEHERGRRFALDPREQLQAQRWARQRRWQVHGAAHSHPQGPLRPSATDRALTLAPALMVIGAANLSGGADGGGLSLQAWWLDPDPEAPPAPLALRVGALPSGDDGE